MPLGGVHGFLGPNGSGKTTTIRMLLGLISADTGTCRSSTRGAARLPQVIDRIGAIVEQPKFFPAFSGRKNLDAAGPRDRCADGAGSARCSTEVGLADRAKDRFRTYSLGMKQRLAIAATLLKDPDLLIFDEPTNGLDPAGIHEIRATMRGLADRGKTVLVSSHILSEVQQVADTVSIIGRGRLLAEGTVDEILDAGGGQSARVGVADPARRGRVLPERASCVTPRRPPRSGSALAPTGRLDLAQITQVLAERGIYVYELMPVRRDLESVFLELTAEEHLGATQQAGRGRKRAAGERRREQR